MYAVIVTGGKQYGVQEGDSLTIATVDVEAGNSITFDQVLMVANGDDVKMGKPAVKGAKVTASVVEHGRGKKVKIIKFRRRKHSMTQQGHRQNYTAVKIEKIES